MIGFTGGEIPTVKVNRLLLNNISVTGVAWGEFIRHNPAYLRQQAEELLGELAAGRLVIPDGPEYSFEEAGNVLTSMEERRLVGKAVLRV